MKCIILAFCLLLLYGPLLAQAPNSSTHWKLTERKSIVWYPDSLSPQGYSDNIEMSGKKVAAILYYQVDEDQNLSLEKELIFPQLRTFNKSNEPGWKKYRAYFKRTIGEDLRPVVRMDSLLWHPSRVDSIEIGGMIRFYYSPVKGLQLTRLIYPSMEQRLLVEEWQISNVGAEPRQFSISKIDHRHTEPGYRGNYTFVVSGKGGSSIKLEPQESYVFPLYIGATLNEEKREAFRFREAKKSRLEFLEVCQEQLVLESPDSILNQLFYFSKIRAAESIYHSSMGLVHSPGGGNYYVGVWANDQIEYSGPFFPYFDYSTGQEAAYNAYQMFLRNIPTDGKSIAYAFEVDGNFAMRHLDRGDAAMIAYGTSLYLLNSGDLEKAEQLWPLISWCLAYCHRQKNQFGAVRSESDEMEGRISTGEANLSTTTLYYGGLKFSIPIAQALGRLTDATLYQQYLETTEQVIEDYFGANIEGLDTYRYFDGNTLLRHWICLPLTMGIQQRKEGTLKALFEKLWTDNGILVQYDPAANQTDQVFWDRATLYTLRGALQAGENELAIEKLQQYSQKRLLGDHVPYAVEAYPENNMKHLSAESALYCRIFIEGMLGLEPLGFSRIRLRPSLAPRWDFMSLKKLLLFGRPLDIYISRKGNQLHLLIESEEGNVFEQSIAPGQTVEVELK